MHTPFNSRPLTDFMGVEVPDFALDAAHCEQTIDALQGLLAQHTLVLFRDQDLEPQAQIAFSARFGPLESHVLKDFCLDGHPEIFVVSNIIENGRHLGAYGGSKAFHTDLAYMEQPSLGSVFRCLECPGEGGQTQFASLFEAFDNLPATEQRWLEQQVAVYDYVWDYPRRQSQRPPLTEEQKRNVPPVRHPCVRTHPRTGRKSMFLTPIWIRCFEGMSEADSQRKLAELSEFATQPKFRYTHDWRPGDVLIWDNRSSLHRQLPFDDVNERRLMYRTTIKGDRPFLSKTGDGRSAA
jgi:taurine dioxygenase